MFWTYRELIWILANDIVIQWTHSCFAMVPTFCWSLSWSSTCLAAWSLAKHPPSLSCHLSCQIVLAQIGLAHRIAASQAGCWDQLGPFHLMLGPVVGKKLSAPVGAISSNFPWAGICKHVFFFTYFPWWANGCYSPGLGHLSMAYSFWTCSRFFSAE